MRTIAIEEHFLATGFREVMMRNAPSHRGDSNEAFMAERQAKLIDLGPTRLQDMDAGAIDLQVISHTAAVMGSPPAEESVRLARQANDQLATAVAAHPTRFAGFATLPMDHPEAAADELERAVRSLGFKGTMINGTTNGRFLDDPVLPANFGASRCSGCANLRASWLTSCASVGSLLCRFRSSSELLSGDGRLGLALRGGHPCPAIDPGRSVRSSAELADHYWTYG